MDLTGAYLLRFKAPCAGQRLWVRLTPMTHGLKDVPVELNAIVGPGAAPLGPGRSESASESASENSYSL